MKCRDAVIANIALVSLLLLLPVYVVWVTWKAIAFNWTQFNETAWPPPVSE